MRVQELPKMHLRFWAWTFTFRRKAYLGQLRKETVYIVCRESQKKTSTQVLSTLGIIRIFDILALETLNL